MSRPRQRSCPNLCGVQKARRPKSVQCTGDLEETKTRHLQSQRLLHHRKFQLLRRDRFRSPHQRIKHRQQPNNSLHQGNHPPVPGHRMAPLIRSPTPNNHQHPLHQHVLPAHNPTSRHQHLSRRHRALPCSMLNHPIPHNNPSPPRLHQQAQAMLLVLPPRLALTGIHLQLRLTFSLTKPISPSRVRFANVTSATISDA